MGKYRTKNFATNDSESGEARGGSTPRCPQCDWNTIESLNILHNNIGDWNSRKPERTREKSCVYNSLFIAAILAGLLHSVCVCVLCVCVFEESLAPFVFFRCFPTSQPTGRLLSEKVAEYDWRDENKQDGRHLKAFSMLSNGALNCPPASTHVSVTSHRF